MAVDGSMLDKYVGKKIKIFFTKDESALKGTLTKDGKKFFLENKKITISKIAAIKEEV
ncbi:hypothetical protein [Parvimonas micra]|jgi:hypothetical protein|nr:MAG TPA: RPA3 [Caudoviricetes sp.]